MSNKGLQAAAGLFVEQAGKVADIIHLPDPWRSLEAANYATLEWIAWYNNPRLLNPIGGILPAEAEA